MEPLTVRPKQLPALLGLSKAEVYKLLAVGDLPSIRCGKAILIPIDRLRRWVAERAEGGRGR